MCLTLKKNDRVHVNFISESSTAFSGNNFSGFGRLDLVEDGRVFGRLDDGTPFVCNADDATKVDIDPSFELIHKIGIKNSRDMLNGYIPATEDLIELKKQWDHWHKQLFNNARVSPNTYVVKRRHHE